MRNTLAIVLVMASGVASAQGAPQGGGQAADPLPASPPSVQTAAGDKLRHDEFCKTAEDTYREIINMPTKFDKGTALSFAIYRNASTQRVLMLAVAARCNITSYLVMEASHARQTLLQQRDQAGQRDQAQR